MSTTATATRVALPATAVTKYDRVFYSSLAVFMAITVLVGFAPTYYLRSLFGAPATVSGATSLSLLTQAHGALFTAWVLLFVVQTALIAQRRAAVHRRVGIAGVVLAAAMVIVGTATALAAAARGGAPAGVPATVFLIIPLTDMVLFAGFVTAAVLQRRNREAHKRLMLLAYICIIVAAVARLPGLISFGPLAFFGVTFVFVLIGMIYDYATRGRVHPVYVWGGAIFLVSVPLRLMIAETAAWQAFAEFLVR
jgi:hypothetical protein